MIAGEIIIENFAYGFVEQELPEIGPGGPTGRTLKCKDIIIDTAPGTPMPGPLVRIRFLNQQTYDEFAAKVQSARITIASAIEVPSNGMP